MECESRSKEQRGRRRRSCCNAVCCPRHQLAQQFGLAQETERKSEIKEPRQQREISLKRKTGSAAPNASMCGSPVRQHILIKASWTAGLGQCCSSRALAKPFFCNFSGLVAAWLHFAPTCSRLIGSLVSVLSVLSTPPKHGALARHNRPKPETLPVKQPAHPILKLPFFFYGVVAQYPT